jgi:hypothetical protein
MDQRNVRVVVGQGDRTRGTLRDVLEADGFEVVGEAAVGADLARMLRAEQPDVVVLDDAIGVAAAQLVAELAPRAKLVVIWPAGVVPIGGAARVDPGDVAAALSTTVGLVAGVELSGLATIDRPDWIDKVRKDPATLREKLATSGTVPGRPSVTELQRRGQRLHPGTGTGRRRSARSTGDHAVPAGVILPIATATQIAVADATVATTPAVEDPKAAINRRIGTIALGGAAVAGALMIALSFGTHRQPSVIAAEPFLPPLVASTSSPSDPPSTPLDGSSDPGGPTAPTTTEPTTTTGGIAPPTFSPSPSTSGGPTAPGTSGWQPTGGPGTGPSAAIAGASAAHNPHGGPPGLLRVMEPTSAGTTRAGGHTPHGAHPEHPSHRHKR